MTMSEGDVAVVHGRQRQRQQKQSLFPHGDDDGGGCNTDGTQFIYVEMSEPSTESYGDLDDHHEHDDSTPPTATDEDHQHDSDDTTTSTTRNHHHPTRRRKYLYIIASLPLLISTLALFGVSFSTRGTSCESNNSLYGSNVNNSSGATSALAETTLVATVPTTIVSTPIPTQAPTDTAKYLRPTSSPSLTKSPTISPSLSTPPTISPSLSTSPTISPSASMSPSSLFDSTCKITGETCTDDKMCCDRRCVPNEEGSGGADAGGAGGGDANAAGGGPGGEAGKGDEKEKEKVEAGEKEKEEPKGRRRMAMERVCM